MRILLVNKRLNILLSNKKTGLLMVSFFDLNFKYGIKTLSN